MNRGGCEFFRLARIDRLRRNLMAPAEQHRSSPPVRRANSGAAAPSITPVFPLLLLQTMRDMDRPAEVLEDEDVTTSLPRRLGLSDVVGIQIRRLQEEVRHKRLQSSSQVEDLIRLVIRRPDAEEIFEEAGRRVARHSWEQRSRAARGAIRLLPRPLALISASRAARRTFRRLTGAARLTVNRWPTELRIEGSLSARADPGGAACAFYGGAFAELLQFYTGRTYRVRHPECETRGGAGCRWTVEVAA
jgi:predicted hydrocarbon binding protein